MTFSICNFQKVTLHSALIKLNLFYTKLSLKRCLVMAQLSFVNQLNLHNFIIALLTARAQSMSQTKTQKTHHQQRLHAHTRSLRHLYIISDWKAPTNKSSPHTTNRNEHTRALIYTLMYTNSYEILNKWIWWRPTHKASVCLCYLW